MDESEIKARIATKLFPESKGGILLCGINWGGGGGLSDSSAKLDGPSFFSDVSTDNACYPFQRKIRRWFELWGYPLKEAAEEAGPFEHCITQTNWIAEGSRYADGVYSREHLVSCASEEFFPVLQYFKPRLFIFLGIQHLPFAFADMSLRVREEEILGPTVEELKEEWIWRANGKKRFRTTKMRFENCVVIGLPHPTPPGGALSDVDIVKLQPIMANAISESGVPYKNS